MPERILALHRADLATAVQLSSQLVAERGDPTAPAPAVTVFDPLLLTHAQTMGLWPVQLVPTPDCDIVPGVTARAAAATRLLLDAADEVLADLVPEARGAGWCAHWLHYLHVNAYGFGNLARRVSPRLAGDIVHVLLPDTPYRYGYHSFVPGLVVSDVLRRAGATVKLHGYTLPPWDAPRLADPFAAAAGDAPAQVDLLCHLPTCFYDDALFADEVRASGRQALVLPSQLFDASLPGLPRCDMVAPQVLAERLPPGQGQQLDATLDRLGSALQAPLMALLPGPRMAHTQIHALLQGYREQALLFFTLERRFAAQPPRTLLLSNQDGGQHGALHSFARRHAIQTLLLPHSKIFNDPVTSQGRDMLCLTHPLQGGEAQDLDGSRLPMATLDFGETWQLPAPITRPLTTLGIVLNSVAINSLCMVDLAAYIEGITRLRAWCQARGVACHIRCRPNGSTIALLVPALGLDVDELLQHQEGRITDFGQRCDLVLGYDTPTSGVFDLLRHGVPVLQALCRRLGPQEWRIVDPDTVPQLPVAEVLSRLDGFCDDPQQLAQLQRDQAARYLQAAARAKPLRHWL